MEKIAFNSVNDFKRSSMTSAGWYFGTALAFLGLFLSPARAQETWQHRLQGYFGQNTPEPRTLSVQESALGLKSTLILGANHAALKLGRYDGFASNPATRILLPPHFQKARDVMERFGLSARLDDLELKMNRAAEDATPRLKPVIDQAIQHLVFQDPHGIASGQDAAATAYFRAVKDAELRKIIQPIIEKSLQDTGGVNTLKIINHAVKTLPMGPDLRFDMTTYVSQKALDGFYFYMAEKEQNIRDRPESAKDDIIKQLFPHD